LGPLEAFKVIVSTGLNTTFLPVYNKNRIISLLGASGIQMQTMRALGHFHIVRIFKMKSHNKIYTQKKRFACREAQLPPSQICTSVQQVLTHTKVMPASQQPGGLARSVCLQVRRASAAVSQYYSPCRLALGRKSSSNSSRGSQPHAHTHIRHECFPCS
jgi:hypothetical protein